MRKNQKGVTLIALCLFIGFVIFLIIAILGNDDSSENKTTTNPKISTPSTSSFVKEDRATYIPKCQTIDYTSLARNPNQYKGNNYAFTGKVIQVMNDGNNVTLRVNVTAKTYTYLSDVYYEDTILVNYTYSSSNESRILENDIITIYGQSLGTYTYESVFGAPITVPAIKAMYIDIRQ